MNLYNKINIIVNLFKNIFYIKYMEGEYYCQRCLKKFLTKYKLKRHFKRKKLCKLNGLDLNYETMLKDATRLQRINKNKTDKFLR